jgi:mono/diheme cytochrome c family protein
MRHAWARGRARGGAIGSAIAVALAATSAFAQDSLNPAQRQGEHLFNQSCRVCHAQPQFNSAQYGPVLSKASASGNPKAMHEVIANGTPRMPGFKHHFKPEQIDAIVAYLQTVSPKAATPSAPPRKAGGNAAEAD